VPSLQALLKRRWSLTAIVFQFIYYFALSKARSCGIPGARTSRAVSFVPLPGCLAVKAGRLQFKIALGPKLRYCELEFAIRDSSKTL